MRGKKGAPLVLSSVSSFLSMIGECEGSKGLARGERGTRGGATLFMRAPLFTEGGK